MQFWLGLGAAVCHRRHLAAGPNFRIEAEENVKRLRNHPCMALWCGNNELEQCKAVNYNGDEEGRMNWKDYARLFDQLLPGIVEKPHPDCVYWPSSEHTPAGERVNTRQPEKNCEMEISSRKCRE